MDFDWLLAEMVRLLRRSAGKWVSFHQLSIQICGDPDLDDVLAALAASRPDLFVLSHDQKVVKLTLEGISSPPPTVAPTPPPPTVTAARAARDYAHQLRPTVVPVVGVDVGRRVLDRYLHRLIIDIADDDLRIADDTPVELVRQDGGYPNPGHIAGTSRDDAALYAAFRHEVLPADVPAKLIVQRGRSFVEVANRLDGLTSLPSRAQDFYPYRSGQPSVAENSSDLATLLTQLGVAWTRFLWGPPGAGKTHCAATFATTLVRSEDTERVLMVAPSNVGVDAFVFQLLAALECQHPGIDLLGIDLLRARKIARYGYSKDERILNHVELFGPAENEELSRLIAEQHRELRQLEQHRAPPMEVAAAQTILQQLQQKRKQVMAEHLRAARVVATTVSSTFMGQVSVAEAGPWPTVIVDEASMLDGSTLLALASLAARRLLVSGDPLQLAPVFEWRANSTPPSEIKHWLAKDPFQLAELSASNGRTVVQLDDPRMARIASQRRCHHDIWALVRDWYPPVRMDVDILALRKIADAAPFPGSAVALLDLSPGRLPAVIRTDDEPTQLAADYESACRQVGRSWQNPPTAMLAIDVAREIRANLPEARIAIITPYRGQVRLLRTWLYAEREADRKLQGIEIGTVHAFQGGDADAVIFDVVDGPPRGSLGALLTGDAGNRLINVAVTRARGKLIIIAHRSWLCRTAPRDGSLLRHIICGDVEYYPVLPPQPTGPSGPEPCPESPIEEIFVAALRRRQAEVGAFVLQYRIHDERERIVSRPDIAFLEARLAIFCDGARYHLDRHQWQRDLRQRRQLVSFGWRVLAFTGSEIVHDVERCIDDVVRCLHQA